MYVFMYTIVNNEVILTLMYEGVFFFSTEFTGSLGCDRKLKPKQTQQGKIPPGLSFGIDYQPCPLVNVEGKI